MFDNFVNFLKENDLIKNGKFHLISFLLIIVVGYVLIKFIMKFLKKAVKKSRLDPICHKFLLSFVKIFLYILLIIIALTQLGFDMTSLVAMLSVAGVAVGLAVQDSLSNLAGGFVILFSKPFKVGDFIEVNSVSGTVKHINIIQTKLLTVDNKAIYIPNGQVSSAKIINFSAETTRRLDLTFSVSYQDNISLAKKIILSEIDRNPMSLKEPVPVVRVFALADHSIDITAKVWVNTENYWDLHYDLLENIKEAFDKNGITIPYNQLDVYVKHVDTK